MNEVILLVLIYVFGYRFGDMLRDINDPPTRKTRKTTPLPLNRKSST